MPSFRSVKVNLISYDGHAINDGSHYLAWLDGDALNLPAAKTIEADVDFDWPVFVGTEKTARTFTIHIQIQDRATWQARVSELNQWFSTQSGDEQYLVALWTEAMSVRRIACRPLDTKIDGLWYTVTLRAVSPYWESNDEESATLSVDSDGDSVTVTNAGNLATPPVIEVTMTAAPASTWFWRRKVLVANGSTQPLTNYPLELTGGWDTAALVANAAKATAIDDGDGITAGDTTITVDSTTGFYARGLIYIGTEQIFYASVDATHFLSCERGVGGTTAAVHANNDAVKQSEMFADGRDVQVELDGKIIKRWFGAAMGASKGPNYNNTLLWAVIPEVVALSTDYKDGYLLTPGTDLAKNKTVTVSTATSGYPGAYLVDDKSSTLWKATAATGNAIIDLGSEMTINRVLIFHPNSADAPKDFTIQTSPAAVSYTTRITVTNNTAKNRYTVHDFTAPVTARYVKIDVTALQTGGKKCTIASVCVYNAQPRLVVKYGNWDSPEVTENLTTKPLFNLGTSTNTSWDYDDFIDDRYSGRPAQWVAFQYQGALAAKFRKYATSQDGADADPAAVLGIAAATATPYYDGLKLNHPGGITQVIHSGYTKMSNTYRTWRLGSIDAKAVTVPNKYENVVNSPTAFTAYGPITTAISPTALTVFFYMYHKATTSSLNYAEATDVTLALTSTPTVTFQAANAASTVYQLTCEIENETAAQSFLLDALVELNQVFEIDCTNFTVEEQTSGLNRLPMLSLPAGVVRVPWLELEPGGNVIAFNDTAVGGATVTLKYRSRWL